MWTCLLSFRNPYKVIKHIVKLLTCVNMSTLADGSRPLYDGLANTVNGVSVADKLKQTGG